MEDELKILHDQQEGIDYQPASDAIKAANDFVINAFALLSPKQRASVRAWIKVATDRLIEWQEETMEGEL